MSTLSDACRSPSVRRPERYGPLDSSGLCKRLRFRPGDPRPIPASSWSLQPDDASWNRYSTAWAVRSTLPNEAILVARRLGRASHSCPAMSRPRHPDFYVFPRELSRCVTPRPASELAQRSQTSSAARRRPLSDSWARSRPGLARSASQRPTSRRAALIHALRDFALTSSLEHVWRRSVSEALIVARTSSPPARPERSHRSCFDGAPARRRCRGCPHLEG